MHSFISNIWLISREYAGIAEAGGVKDVVSSLAEELFRLHIHVTVFLPLYGCTTLDNVTDYKLNCSSQSLFSICGKQVIANYDSGKINGIDIVFIKHPAFLEKLGVYTYTSEEEKIDSFHKSGIGHADVLFLDILFQKAVLEYGLFLPKTESPDIIHCHDATTAIIPVLLKEQYQNKEISFYMTTKCLVTIHNAGIGYHHEFISIPQATSYTNLSRLTLEHALCGCHVEPFLLACQNAILTTVSPGYANELVSFDNLSTGGLSSSFFLRKISIIGITNGIDFNKYNPADPAVSLLPFGFSPEKKHLEGKYHCREYLLKQIDIKLNNILKNEVEKKGNLQPLLINKDKNIFICYHGRLVQQKGIEQLVEAAEIVIQQNPYVFFIIMGHGDKKLEDRVTFLSLKYIGRIVYYKGYNKELSRLCTASADFIALPSNFEPCGLEDFISQIFGTIPVAHATGGLNKIVHGITGFLYKPNTSKRLAEILLSLIQEKQNNPTIFNDIIYNAALYIHTKYTWESIVKNEYMPLYKKIMKNLDFNY